MKKMEGSQGPIFNFLLISMVTVCLWEKCVDPFRVEGSFRRAAPNARQPFKFVLGMFKGELPPERLSG